MFLHKVGWFCQVTRYKHYSQQEQKEQQQLHYKSLTICNRKRNKKNHSNFVQDEIFMEKKIRQLQITKILLCKSFQ